MRRKVLDAIDEWYRSDRRSALMISGARQVGKTYAVEEFCKLNGLHSIRIDLSKDERSRQAFAGDLTVDAVILGLSAVHTSFEFIPGETLIFLDEIQECPDARTALKSFAEDGRYKVVASGSLLRLRMNEVRLTPAGYVETVDMTPMDFEEFLWALGVPQAPIAAVRSSVSKCEPVDSSLFATFSEYYRWYVVVGGMPEAVDSFVRSKQFGPVRKVQNKIVEGYKEDIRKHIEDEALRSRVEACFDAIPGMLASENKRFVFNEVEDGKTDARGYYNGYDRYAPALDWLSMAKMTLTCRKVSEIHMPLKASARDSMFKLYMLDTGILMALYEPELIGETVHGNMDAKFGAVAENAIAQAFAAQGRSLYYHREPKGRTEADFVTTIDGKLCAIAVRTGRNRTSPSVVKLKDAGLDGMILETRNCFVDDRGVRHYPLFAASFMDSVDGYAMPEFDFGSVDRLRAEYGDG